MATYYGTDNGEFILGSDLPDEDNFIFGGEGHDTLEYDFLSPANPFSIAVGSQAVVLTGIPGDGRIDSFTSVEEVRIAVSLTADGLITGSLDVFERFYFVFGGGWGSSAHDVVMSSAGDAFTFADENGNAISVTNIDQMWINVSFGVDTFTFHADSHGDLPLTLIDSGDASTTFYGSDDPEIFEIWGDDTVFGFGDRDEVGIYSGGNNVNVDDSDDFVQLVIPLSVTESQSIGPNTYWPAHGSNTLDGGEGNDILAYNFSGIAAPLTIEFSRSNDDYLATRSDGGTDYISNFDAVVVFGSLFYANHIIGSDLPDTLFGGGGNDILDGGGGDDSFNFSSAMLGTVWVPYGKGDDTYEGGAGDDRGWYSGESATNYQVDVVFTLVGTELESKIVVTDLRLESVTGTDTILGIEAIYFDDLYILATTSDSTVNLYEKVAIASAENEVIYVIQNNLIASIGNDAVTGNDNDNDLKGGAGDDTLLGNFGNDGLYGGDGEDTLHSGNGNDYVDGGNGNDLIIGGSGAGDDTYYGGEGIDLVKFKSAPEGIVIDLFNGTAHGTSIGTDNLFDIEGVVGGQGGDRIIGDSLANVIKGGKGSDRITGKVGEDALFGNAGDDILVGAAGNDRLEGKMGADILRGAAGSDVLTGGSGHDQFVFNKAIGADNVDTITDFLHATDTIKLDIDVFAALSTEGNHLVPEQFEANAAGVAFSPEARIIYNTSSGVLFYDPDGNGALDATPFAILEDTPALSAGDFLVIA